MSDDSRDPIVVLLEQARTEVQTLRAGIAEMRANMENQQARLFELLDRGPDGDQQEARRAAHGVVEITSRKASTAWAKPSACARSTSPSRPRLRYSEITDPVVM